MIMTCQKHEKYQKHHYEWSVASRYIPIFLSLTLNTIQINMKRKYRQQTDAEHRERAILVLERAKTAEAKKKPIPMKIGDKDNTILLISPKLSLRQREKLRQKKLNELSKNKINIVDGE